VPIFLFYFWEKLALRVADARIWSTDYFVSAWQPVIDALHSFPLILLALALARWGKRPLLIAFTASLLLHALCDFPLHGDDAHRQLFPFSDLRFRSPVSYWDPRRHGTVGSAIEVLCVVASCLAIARRRSSRLVTASMVVVAAAYVLMWVVFYGRHGG
jgi:hypothetical protein